MRKILLLFFAIVAFNGIAQKLPQERIDSLSASLPKASDTEKLNIYVQLMNTYNLFDREAALRFEKPAMELAMKIGPAGVGEIKNVLGRIYWRQRLFDVAVKYHTESKQIFESVNDKGKTALSIRYLGQDYADGGNYPQALKYFNSSLELYKKLGDKRNMANLLELFVWVYSKQGDFLKASQAGYDEISLFEELGSQNDVAIAAAAVADSYIQLGNYMGALKLFQQSERVYRLKGDQINLGHNHLFIGKAQKLMGLYADARKSFDSALQVGQKFNDIAIAALAHQGIADVYLAQQNSADALAHYLSAAQLFSKAVIKADLARVYCSIGECYRIEKRFDLARKYYDDASALAEQTKSKALLADYFHGVEKLDSAMGNWKGAYFNHKDFTSLRDSVFNQDNVGKMVALQMRHEFDKRESAAQLIQHDKDSRQRRQLIFLGIIAVLVLILASVLYRNQKRVARINQELEVKSESLEEENYEKTSILKIVSHDLRSPFSKIKGLTSLLRIEKNLNEKDKELYFSHIDASINQGNYLIQHLLDAQTLDHASSIPHVQTLDLAKFVQDYQQVTQRQLQGKRQLLHTAVESKNNLILTDPQMITRVIDNLISNASKFSAIGASIYLRVWSEEKWNYFSVRDEGPGISEEDQKKLFRKFQKLSAQPTAGENSTGLGLSITKALVEKLNGTIRVVSASGTGTEMIIAIPN